MSRLTAQARSTNLIQPDPHGEPDTTIDDDSCWLDDEDSDDNSEEHEEFVEATFEAINARKRIDERTRHDRVPRRNNAWEGLYERLTEAFLAYEMSGAPSRCVDGTLLHEGIAVIDMYGEW